jgi:hypothetical protein
VTGKISDEKAARYYEEVIRLMNEMVQEVTQMRIELQRNNRTCDELNERVRKITLNTS